MRWATASTSFTIVVFACGCAAQAPRAAEPRTTRATHATRVQEGNPMDRVEVAPSAQMDRALARVLHDDSGVEPGYRHYPKQVTVGDPIELPGAVLKWYGVHTEDRPIPDAVTRLARERLAATPLDARGFGFAILHRCGNDFYFLIVGTWKNSNELWQTVFYKDGDKMADFGSWPRAGAHIPTLCVWELVPALHERDAWVRFLESPRDVAAARAWLGDRYRGPA